MRIATALHEKPLMMCHRPLSPQRTDTIYLHDRPNPAPKIYEPRPTPLPKHHACLLYEGPREQEKSDFQAQNTASDASTPTVSDTVDDERGVSFDKTDTDLDNKRSKHSPAITIFEDVDDYSWGQDNPTTMTPDCQSGAVLHANTTGASTMDCYGHKINCLPGALEEYGKT
jgi:hypothetical protein